MEHKDEYFISSKIPDMEEKRPKILYLHGLESKLGDAKREILQDYGDVTAPDMDYKKNPKMIETLIRDFQNEKFDVIMGSSMGGFVGFYLAKVLKVPALLFNPALPYRSVEQEIPKQIPQFHTKPVQIVMGVKDPVIKAADNLKFLAENLPQENIFDIHLRNELEHRIVLEVFEQEIGFFFREF